MIEHGQCTVDTYCYMNVQYNVINMSHAIMNISLNSRGNYVWYNSIYRLDTLR